MDHRGTWRAGPPSFLVLGEAGTNQLPWGHIQMFGTFLPAGGAPPPEGVTGSFPQSGFLYWFFTSGYQQLVLGPSWSPDHPRSE